MRAIGRSAERLRSLAEKGAETSIGSVTDRSAMTRAFEGAKVVYVMIPPSHTAENLRAYQNEVARAYARAIGEAGIQHVLTLSSIGAHLSQGTGPISGLHDFEQELNQVSHVNIVHLRPAFFMENLFLGIDLIKNQNVNGTPIRGDLLMPMIATRDIAEVAVQLLISLHFSGKSARELLGQRDVSMREVTRIIGKAVGKESLAHVQFPYEQAERGMVAMGLSQDAARSLNEMYLGMNEGRIRPLEGRTNGNTTLTSIEQFAEAFAAVYRGREDLKAKGI